MNTPEYLPLVIAALVVVVSTFIIHVSGDVWTRKVSRRTKEAVALVVKGVILAPVLVLLTVGSINLLDQRREEREQQRREREEPDKRLVALNKTYERLVLQKEGCPWAGS